METKRLIINEYNLNDFNDVYQMVSDKETMKHYPSVYNEKGAKRWIEWNLNNYQKYHFGWYALRIKETKQYIGDCGITMQKIKDQFLPELGYHIYKTYQNQGYAYEASQKILNDFFQRFDYNEIYSYMTVDNIASYKLAEKLGFKRINEYIDDYYGKMYIYKLTKEEYVNGKNNK